MRNSRGFSIIEALIAAALISIAALGLGNAVSKLSQSRQKSQMVSLSIGFEASMIAALQSPSTYSAYKAQLQHGQIPTGMSIIVPGDTPVTLTPGQTVYLTKNLQTCQGFSDANCALQVSLSQLQNIGGQFSFAYFIQGNPKMPAMTPLGSPNLDDYSVTIPVDVYQDKGTDINCDDPTVDIGMMGIGDDGKPICLQKPTAADTCATGTLAKGFQVIFDPGTKNFRLAFQCSTPLRVLTCPAPAGSPYPGGYALQSFLPVSLDPSSASSSLAYNTCIFVASNPSAYANSGGTNYVLTQRDGVQMTNACPPGYKPQATRCDIANASGQDVNCTSGITIHYVPVTSAQPSVTGNIISCQTVVPSQPYCGNSPGNPAYQTKAWADANLSYQCVMDGTVPESIPATSN